MNSILKDHQKNNPSFKFVTNPFCSTLSSSTFGKIPKSHIILFAKKIVDSSNRSEKKQSILAHGNSWPVISTSTLHHTPHTHIHARAPTRMERVNQRMTSTQWEQVNTFHCIILKTALVKIPMPYVIQKKTNVSTT